MIVYADNIIENSVFLRNINKTANDVEMGTWNSGSSNYASYVFDYETPLEKNHIYYLRATWKYTTTNQSPTWCMIHIQDGVAPIDGSKITNLVANTEYIVSGIGTTSHSWKNLTLKAGNLYNGYSSEISGMTAYVKDAVAYDITELYQLLKSRAIVTSESEMKTWCDKNLPYKKPGINFDISSVIDSSDKLFISKGNIIGNTFIETDGMQFYTDDPNIRKNTYFDTGFGVAVYNNKGNGTVVFERVDARKQQSPFAGEHPYVLKITTNGEASPGMGGFYARHTAIANGVFIERFVAKIPVGYNVHDAWNPQGTGPTVTWLTPTAGTGDQEEYAVLYRCGSTGSFSTGGHVYLYADSGMPTTGVSWYVAYCNNCNVTGNEHLINFTALPNKAVIKNGCISARKFDTKNIFPNGDFAIQDTSILSNKSWYFDTEDVAGNAKASLVQPVGAPPCALSYLIPIDPTCRYRVSLWIKHKGDMSSYYFAPYLVDSTGTRNYSFNVVMYATGTMTKLTADLKTGDTQMAVASNSGWGAKPYSGVGFRSTASSTGWHDLGAYGNSKKGADGLIDSIEGSTIVKFKVPYNGPNKPAGTVVCQSGDGNNQPYPIWKTHLNTYNEPTWQYVTGTFGADNAVFDGEGLSWSGGIPFVATHMKILLNYSSNNGTVPIKFADIRIEAITPNGGNRVYDKVQYARY